MSDQILHSKNFRPIPGYASYSVDAFGTIISRRRKRARVMEPVIVGGYYSNHLVGDDGVTKLVRVHWCVAAAWIGGRPPGMVIDHRNSCKLDNRANNLQFVSNARNIALSSERGDLCRKLTRAQVAEVVRRQAAGETIASLARTFNVSETTVRHHVQRARRLALEATGTIQRIAA